MKVLTIANEKGGVGKTLLTTQFAYYCALKFGLKTVVLDFDQQGNTSSILEGSGKTTQAAFTSFEMFTRDLKDEIAVQEGEFLLCKAENRLSVLEKQGDEAHGMYAQQLKSNISYFESKGYDLMIIDTNPNPDVRSDLGLFVCTHLLSPIALNKEPIDGIVRLCDRIDAISSFNPNLPGGFLGILPNILESSWRFQMNNAKELMANFGNLLLKTREISLKCYLDENKKIQLLKEDGDATFSEKEAFCAIKSHAAIAEAQQRNLPIWEMQNGTEAWAEMKRAFFSILESLNIRKECSCSNEEIALIDKVKSTYGLKAYSQALRQFFLTDNTKSLPKLSISEIHELRALRSKIPFSETL